jgi:hypothetical protein
VQDVKDAADKRKREQQLEAALESSRAGRARVFSALGRGRGRPRGAGAAAADTPPPLPLGGRRLQEPQRFFVDENIRDRRSSDKNARPWSATGAPLSDVRRGKPPIGLIRLPSRGVRNPLRQVPQRSAWVPSGRV